MNIYKSTQRWTMSVAEYHEHCNEYNGLCLACGAINYGGHEPDAINRKCEECGKRASCGTETVMILDYIIISDDFRDDDEDSPDGL